MTHEEMILAYEQLSAATTYIIGFAMKHKIYFTQMNGLPTECTAYEMASRQQGMNLRLRVRKAMKENLLPACVCLGEDTILTDNKYNKGEMFEKAITEYFGQTWTKDNIPFTKQGDINVNGIEIQIKFDGATFCNTKQLLRLVG